MIDKIMESYLIWRKLIFCILILNETYVGHNFLIHVIIWHTTSHFGLLIVKNLIVQFNLNE